MYVVHATALVVFALLFMHVQVVTRFLMAGSPVLPWLAAIMTTRVGREQVPLCEDDNLEVLRKVECRSNLRSNTDTVLFQVNTKHSQPSNWSYHVNICSENDLKLKYLILHFNLFLTRTDFQEKLETDKAQWVMMFFLGYTLVGTILFSNHLPWT